MRTLAGAAACLCAGAGLFHFPSLGQRGLIDILKAKPLSLVFVKGLGEEKKGTPVKAKRLKCSVTAEDTLKLATTAPSCVGNQVLKTVVSKPPGRVQRLVGKMSQALCKFKPARLSRSHGSNTSFEVVLPLNKKTSTDWKFLKTIQT